jgi:hypothetical protein
MASCDVTRFWSFVETPAERIPGETLNSLVPEKSGAPALQHADAAFSWDGDSWDGEAGVKLVVAIAYLVPTWPVL